MGFEALVPSAGLLAAGVLLDALTGDPQVRFHPIRLLGKTLSAYELLLRRLGCDGYAGGIALFLMLTLTWVAVPSLLLAALSNWNMAAAIAVHIVLIDTGFALHDLIAHARRVQQATGQDIAAARQAIGMLVGRDLEKMDIAACRRAAIESLSENFVDGVLSAIFWYVLLGIPGLLLFKVVSTMDSMVGYKNVLYLRFGWCGARLDDLMNYIPARLAWLMLGLFAIPKGWRIGYAQHAILPGPNPGWSEATMAGVLDRKLIGPLWKDGQLVTEQWIGKPENPEAGNPEDLKKAIWITIDASLMAVLLGMISIHAIWR